MYVNDMRWAGRLADDPKVFDPRQEGDKTMFSFRVAQTIPWRNKSGATEEATQYLGVNYRCSPQYSERLKEKLKKGQFVLVDGELIIENRDTATGRATFVNINASKIQFPPVQYVNPKEPGEPESKSDSKPDTAEKAKPDYFNPARFDDA